jgi:hypothetical protein
MIKHNPTLPAFRVAVCRRSDSVQVGTMPAAAGMILFHGGKVVKVNAKSVVVRREGISDTRMSEPLSVSVAEATQYGFPRG